MASHPFLPAITTEQMREVDRLTIEAFGIQLIQMMEHAGRLLAELVRRRLEGTLADRHVVVAAGRGHNGGGGLVAARFLSSWGAAVTVLVESGRSLRDVPARHWETLAQLPVRRLEGAEATTFLTEASLPADLIVDALIGYGLRGDPRGWIAAAIEAINRASASVVALDVPSGLDATTGEAYRPCIKADATMMLALPKAGLLMAQARPFSGELYLADIGVPPAVYRQMGLDVAPVFSSESLIILS